MRCCKAARAYPSLPIGREGSLFQRHLLQHERRSILCLAVSDGDTRILGEALTP